MALINNTAVAHNTTVNLYNAVEKDPYGAVETVHPYTDAVMRDVFAFSSVQIPDGGSVQISNKPTPDETTDDDWISVAEDLPKFVSRIGPFVWLRLKGVPFDSSITVRGYVLSALKAER